MLFQIYLFLLSSIEFSLDFHKGVKVERTEMSRYVPENETFKLKHNKKVLLRERKRHTDRCVASARYAVPVGGTPLSCLGPDLDGGGGGTPFPGPGGGYPSQVWTGRVPHPAGEEVPLGMGYPPPPTWTWEVGTPPSRCGLTHKVKILPSLILWMRVVKIIWKLWKKPQCD